MSRLVWDKVGERFYETGVERGVIYSQNSFGLYASGAVWNGLSAVTESPSGAEPNSVYADNKKYLSIVSAEEYNATVEAYGYPDNFNECLDSWKNIGGLFIGQQKRSVFGLCYRTILGNDEAGNDYGYKLHLIYGLMASSPEKGYTSINESPEAMTMSWELTSTPISMAGYKPISSITINSTKIQAHKLKELEDILYGTADSDARLPLPDEVIKITTNRLLDSNAESLKDSSGNTLLDN